MAIRKWYGALVAGGLVGVIVAGCSSGSSAESTSDGGGGDDAGIRKMLDSGISVTGGDDADSGGVYDGTTGKECTSDADCVPDGGPAINTCSIDYSGMFTIGTVPVALFATPVCIIPPSTSSTEGNCNPLAAGDIDDGLPHFCDGPDNPDAPGPGICLPFDQSNPQPNQGTCYPLCTFPLDGSKPVGCAGTDSCFPMTFERSATTGAITGYGFCDGGCQQDSDCSKLGTGFVCQTDIGFCTTAKLARTKAIGAACTASTGTTTTTTATDDESTGACSCDANSTTGEGFCSSSCIVGGLPCPNGWTCDAGYPNPLVFSSSTGAAVSVAVTAQNMGVPGTCTPACTLADAGVVDSGVAPAVDAGESDGAVATPADGGASTCPPNSTCQSTDVAGPDCQP
jgi:hypothetical protein